MHNLFLEFSLSSNTWIHLATTLSKKTTTVDGNFYVNGDFKGTKVKSCCGTSYMINDHVVYDVGYRRDSRRTTFLGHLKDLDVFGKVLTHDMISDVYREFATFSTAEARDIKFAVYI